MITLPSITTLPRARLYGDSADGQIVYVDLLHPAPVRGNSAIRWMPIPNSLAYLVGEVRFGPGNEGFGDVPELVSGQRLIPMPWEIVPVFAWYRQGDSVQVVARGKTSGFGSSNAVFNGTAPLSAMISPVLVSAELVCKARLVGAQVNGNGRPDALEGALGRAALGDRAAWNVSLGEALVDMLTELLGSADLTLTLDVDNPKTDRDQGLLAELRQLALIEWAHRVQALVAPELTLAAPAALVKISKLTILPMLDLAWSAGSTVVLRAVRVLQPVEMGPSVPSL